jgi:hypothetical protein
MGGQEKFTSRVYYMYIAQASTTSPFLGPRASSSQEHVTLTFQNKEEYPTLVLPRLGSEPLLSRSELHLEPRRAD